MTDVYSPKMDEGYGALGATGDSRLRGKDGYFESSCEDALVRVLRGGVEGAGVVEEEGGAEDGGYFGAVGEGAEGDGGGACVEEAVEFLVREVTFGSDDEEGVCGGGAGGYGPGVGGHGGDKGSAGMLADCREGIGQQVDGGEPVAAALLADFNEQAFPLGVELGGVFAAGGSKELEAGDADLRATPEEFFEGLVAVERCLQEGELVRGRGLLGAGVNLYGGLALAGLLEVTAPHAARAVEQLHFLPIAQPHDAQGMVGFGFGQGQQAVLGGVWRNVEAVEV